MKLAHRLAVLAVLAVLALPLLAWFAQGVSRPAIAASTTVTFPGDLEADLPGICDGDDAAAGGGGGVPQGDEVLPGIHRLAGTEPGAPADDLAPLGRLIGDARMVGLGESVHTSGGYYEMKHRLFRYLVEELGFRAFAFESPWSSALETGEYVASCAGNPREATRSLFGVWQAQEVADLLAWMCDWNRRHPRDRVVFFGYDIQQGPDDREALLELFVSFGLAPSDPRLAGLRRCLPAGSGSRPTADQTTDCLAALDALGPELPALAEAAGLPPRELAFARLRFVSLRAHVEKQHLQDDFPASYAARDAGMAEVLFTLRDLLAPGARTAVWAHNGHVGKGRPYRLLSMGTHLDEELGKDYVVLGLTASRALIDWPGQGCGDASGGHPPDSVERRLAGLGAPYLLVDLDFPGAAEPFLAPGVPYSLDRQLTVPRTHYDALVYLDLSPAMTPLFRAPCR